MKFSNYYTQCGTIFHPITPIIDGLKTKESKSAIIVCDTDEIFDEAMVTIMNRFPQAIGLVTVPHPGSVMKERKADVIITLPAEELVLKPIVVTKETYEANKAELDALNIAKYDITFSGGQK